MRLFSWSCRLRLLVNIFFFDNRAEYVPKKKKLKNHRSLMYVEKFNEFGLRTQVDVR
jgi:hypothetical protein